jgi:hypothetical protein
MVSAIEQWRALKVYNSHGLMIRFHDECVEGPPVCRVYIEYSSNDGSRIQMGKLDGWYITSPYFYTDPGTTLWKDRGRKAFPLGYTMGRTRQELRQLALRDAIKWCNVKYGTKEWAKIPGFGRDWFPQEVADWAKRYLKEARAE